VASRRAASRRAPDLDRVEQRADRLDWKVEMRVLRRDVERRRAGQQPRAALVAVALVAVAVDARGCGGRGEHRRRRRERRAVRAEAGRAERARQLQMADKAVGGARGVARGRVRAHPQLPRAQRRLLLRRARGAVGGRLVVCAGGGGSRVAWRRW
jgi:hypothetical protein